MKRVLFVGFLLFLLIGCSSQDRIMNKVILLRSQIDKAETINFQCKVTADYGDSLYVFGLNCEYGSNQTLKWEVSEPETIAGLCGSIVNDKGQFVFDQEKLMFELLADGQITPIGAPWVLLKAIHSGYVRSCGVDDDCVQVQIDDSFSGLQFSVDVWLDKEGTPKRGEIIWQGRRIVSIEIIDFKIL